ncbi:MAG TPA: DoxX family membrane protein [Chloroflexota bacterium]|jgi:thiosulfate dehydrogenase [quinone] large subunit
MIETRIETARPTLPALPLTRALFTSASMSWIWLVIRVYVGWQWLKSGLGKVSEPGWVGDGSALLSYWQRAVAVPPAPAKPAITYDWYRSFLQSLIDSGSHTWFAQLVVWGEVLVGIGLIVGAVVGVTAFFGALMNMNYMLAGSASTNPVLFLLAVLLMLAWRTAGHLGADYFVLPFLATRRQRRAPAEAVPADQPLPVLPTLAAADRRSEVA